MTQENEKATDESTAAQVKPTSDASDKPHTDKVRDSEKQKKDESKKLKSELEEAHKVIKTAEAKFAAEHDLYLRLAAEYDNFRKRTRAESENTYAAAYGELLTALLPTFDNIERATGFDDLGKLKEGLNLTLSGMLAALKSLGIEQIDNTTFNPNLHNAVMHIDDPNYGEGQIVEVLQKGYKRGEKVIRYSNVKTAN